MQRWSEIEQFLLEDAAGDLADGDMARPCVVAFRGDTPLFIAFLRPFAKGAYAEPMIEILALAGGLAADRLMASFSARAWSLDDPIPPVLPGAGDLRQRVLQINVVDATSGATEFHSILRPFDVVDGEVVWGAPLDLGRPEGWIAQALQVAVEDRESLRAGDDELRRQVLRCDGLGHLVGLGPEVAARLGFAAAAASSPGPEG